MRLALALCATLVCAQAAAAQPVEDRYGPARPRAHPAAAQQVASLTPYDGRLLSWSSKAAAPAPAYAEPVAAPPAEPVRAPVVQPEPAPVAAAPVPAPQPAPISARPRAAPRPAVAALPDSLYAPPPPVAQPAPQRVAAAAPPATAAPVGSRTHFYSVHREYGLAPDAIPAPSQANRYVLIGPPEGAADDRRKADDDQDRPF